MISYNGFSSRVREQLEDPTVRTYLNLGLTLMAIILLSVFALRPAFLTVYELSLKLTQAKERSLELKNKVALMSQAQDNYQKASPDIPLILASIPKEPEIVKAIDQINSAAAKTGVTIVKVEAGNTPVVATGEATMRQSAKLEAVVEGPLPAVQQFVGILEKATRLTQISKVTAEYKEGSYLSSVTMSVFYEK